MVSEMVYLYILGLFSMVEDEKREGIKSRDFVRQEENCATLLDSVTAFVCRAGCFLCFPPVLFVQEYF